MNRGLHSRPSACGVGRSHGRAVRWRPDRGIALPAAVFLIVVVSALLAAGLAVLNQSQHGLTLQTQSARALAAARSGVDWGLWKVGDPTGALGLGPTTLPECFASTSLTLPGALEGLTVQVSCTREPASGAVDEGGLKLVSYRVVAQATHATSGSNEYVSRQVEARYTACRNPAGLAPQYAC